MPTKNKIENKSQFYRTEQIDINRNMKNLNPYRLT